MDRFAEHRAAALAQRAPFEKNAAAVVKRLFARQRKVVLAKVKGTKARKGTRYWEPADGREPVVTKQLSTDDFWDSDQWDQEFQDDLSSVYDDVYSTISPEVANQLEDNDFDPKAPGVAAAIAAYIAHQSKTAAKANETTVAQIQAAISSVEAAGGTPEDLYASINSVFDQADTSRAKTIGDYVVTAAIAGAGMIAAGAYSAAQSGQSLGGAQPDGTLTTTQGKPVSTTGITKHWLSMGDEKVRPTHAQADDDFGPGSPGVALDQPFDVGSDSLMYPGDPAGSLAETANCRCSLIFSHPQAQPVAAADTGTAKAFVPPPYRMGVHGVQTKVKLSCSYCNMPANEALIDTDSGETLPYCAEHRQNALDEVGADHVTQSYDGPNNEEHIGQFDETHLGRQSGTKGDLPGHDFHGNQWESGGGGAAKPPDGRNKLPVSTFIDPKTGQPMDRTQSGAIGERLFEQTTGADLATKLGGGSIEHLSEGTKRTAPLDFRIGKVGVEVKTISSKAKYQKTGIKLAAKARKEAEATRLGLTSTVTVLQVLDLQAGTLKSAYAEGIQSRGFKAMTPIGTYDVVDALKAMGYKRIEDLDLEEKILFQNWLATKGDSPGHAFRGNQHTGGIGGAGPRAGQMVAKAVAAEPGVTADVSNMAARTGGQMVGLEFAVKKQSSLADKIQTDAVEKGITQDQAAAKMGDVLRYTTSFPHSQYSAGVNQSMNEMAKKGYTLEKFKNTWPPEESNAYRGVNTNWLSPSGQRFEMQYHTPESFACKQANHADYEEARKATTSDARALELNTKMIGLSSQLLMPAGAGVLAAPPGSKL